uniref:Uncharacterized protein n=1 Tax=Candidatus Kentrum eta TaxID=2126337 RepID=A0A450UIK0_9GAMM|nr:MAG: hypothetical protein BECKH772A_GA0070896_100428 [Candidatus Kentron sp. H]VFJ93329.1 MAG: hypothetical protein BECKH772B_GA0070898_100428 [Candidatus Kentron sp. H]VFK00119.1 MAG: hypothetical protein BECKH772C_GA0070978_100408 [Candidatus Kentron sp. H]
MAKPLLQENPWVRDPKKRKRALRRSAASSSAVEGIHKPFAAKSVNPRQNSSTTAGSRG